MNIIPQTRPVTFPHPDAPTPGTMLRMAEGIYWARLRLPYQLNHINVYLIEDEGGFAVLDTGIGIDETYAAWDMLLAGPLAGKRVTKVICSHYHPDHVGLVGWLTERFDAPLYMPRTEYLTTLAIQHRAMGVNRNFYEERGLPHEVTETVTTRGLGYLRLVTGLPAQFVAIGDGDTLRIGGRDFDIITGGGHSPEQAMLYCRADNIFLSVDQVLTKISPNISVQAMEPQEDPLAQYLQSLARLRATLPEDALVLPGHHVPFFGLHTRLDELMAHHAERCGMIAQACAAAPQSATDLVPVIFRRELDPHQMSFAFSEVVAHLNYMRGRGELTETRGSDGVLRVAAS